MVSLLSQELFIWYVMEYRKDLSVAIPPSRVFMEWETSRLSPFLHSDTNTTSNRQVRLGSDYRYLGK